MADMMIFPSTVEEFMEQYKITDTEHIYTNGADLVPIFRMRQWFEHAAPEQKRERWTPVTERLPEDGKYLCRDDAGIHSVLNCTAGKFNVFRMLNGKLYDKAEIKDIAYWMPLPESPEEEET